MSKSYKAAFSAILFAVSAVISAAETLIPLPLGVKPGFSNIPVMIALSELGGCTAACIAVSKAFFVFMTRGLTAFIMSFSGGMLSLLVMFLIFKITKASFLTISICGSLAHNIGQIIAACCIMKTSSVIFYLPALIVSGCIAGTATGLTVNLLIPRLKPFFRRNK